LIIDTHAHIIVPEITREFAPGEEWRPRVFYEGHQQVVEYKGKQIKSAIHPFVHIEQILEEQEKAGVDRTILCPWVTLLRYEVEPEEGMKNSHIQNQSLAILGHKYPGRVYGLGTVPLQDPELAARELETLMKETGLYGVEVAASVRGVYLGDDRFRTFWAAAEENGALVFIHPTTRGFESPVFNQYYLWNTVGNPLETTITAAHMIMAGIMEAHPQLKILLAHAGGALLALRGRLDHAHSFQPQTRERLEGPPSESLKKFYFDTITHDAGLLRQLVDFAGADHVLVGSDYPFDMGVGKPGEIVRKLNLLPDEESKILSLNALRLLGKES
jgi:aminocarboxymuconate-semialdehyde decarboxylase